MKSIKTASAFFAFALMLLVSFDAKAQSGKSKEKSHFYYFSSIDFLYDDQSGENELQPLANSSPGRYAFVQCVKHEQKKTISVNLYNNKKELVTTELYSIGNGTMQKNIMVTDAAGRKNDKTVLVNEVVKLD